MRHGITQLHQIDRNCERSFRLRVDYPSRVTHGSGLEGLAVGGGWGGWRRGPLTDGWPLVRRIEAKASTGYLSPIRGL